MTADSVGLTGIGVATPPGAVDQAASAAVAEARCCATDEQRAWLQRIYRHSGVRRRASVLLQPEGGPAGFEAFYPPPVGPSDAGPGTNARLRRYVAEARPLAERACRSALGEAGTEPAAITHLVTVSCTGMASPGLDMALIQDLDLSPDVGRVNIGFMGCHGALNGLQTAGALARSAPGARVLLCCVELCSLHFHYGWDPQKVVANALFADGAGAVVLGPQDGTPGWRLVDTASRLAPGSGDAMTWCIGDHGFEMTLSREVPRLIRGAVRPWLEAWLGRHGLGVRDVAHWAIHPGGPRVVETALDALGLPETAGDTSRAVLADHGNMSSPTVLFILNRLRAQNATGPCVVMGFGPGLALEAALLR